MGCPVLLWVVSMGRNGGGGARQRCRAPNENPKANESDEAAIEVADADVR
jgi:hypothetical protein